MAKKKKTKKTMTVKQFKKTLKKTWKFVNGWKSNAKQDDKVVVEVRFGKVTLVNFEWDKSNKDISLSLLNFKVEKK